jgi:hypothetical protein
VSFSVRVLMRGMLPREHAGGGEPTTHRRIGHAAGVLPPTVGGGDGPSAEARRWAGLGWVEP